LTARRTGAAAVLLLFLSQNPLRGQKTDLLTMRNGDRLTGEIKKLDRGQLQLSTAALGTISIRWESVIRVSSRRNLELELRSGRKLYGQLSPSSPDSSVQLLVGGQRRDTVNLGEVVGIVPVSNRVIDRLHAFVDLGLTLAAVDQARTLTIDAGVSYRAPTTSLRLTYNGFAKNEEGREPSTHNTVKLQAQRYLTRRWQGVGVTGFDQSEELDLDARWSLGGAAARQLVLDNHNDLAALAGVVGTDERYSGVAEWKLNFEGLIGMAWDVFYFEGSKLKLRNTINVYPSISNPGRVRADFSLRWRYDLFGSFSTGIDLTDSFDSRPPNETINRNDYILKLTLGWSYK